MKTTLCPLLLLLLAISLPAAGEDTLSDKVVRATGILTQLLDDAEAPPPQLLEKTACLAVIPRLIKGAFGVGGRRGKGVLSCRVETGWSPLVFLKISGASVGFQIGGQATDLVLLIVEERSMRSLLKSQFTLGADASVAAGPRSARANASTDLRFDAEIYSYATSKGLFVGAAVDGAKVSLNRKAISKYYNVYVRPEDILFGAGEVTLPAEAQAFLEALP